MQGRIGRAYRDGKYFVPDSKKAIEWMRKAADHNKMWAKKELMKLLWDCDLFSELLCISQKYAEEGLGDAMGYLGRIYSRGLGVKVNHILSTEWYVKAASTDVKWKAELLSLLYSKGKFRTSKWVAPIVLRGDKLVEAFSAHNRGYSGDTAAILHDCAKNINPTLSEQLTPYYLGDGKSNYILDSIICGCASFEERRELYPKLKTSSENMAILHEMYVVVLDDLLRVCDVLGIDFIASGGTVLGTVRHGGFIPWDDDVDTHMFESDVSILSDFLKSIDSIIVIDEYTAYGRFYKVGCKRFRMSLDIFPLVSCVTICGKQVFYDYKVKSATGSDVVYYSTRDCHPESVKLVINESDMYPLKRMKFETIEMPIFANEEPYLKKLYGDYMSLPRTLWAHMSENELEKYANSWKENSHYLYEEIERFDKLFCDRCI